MGIKDVFSRIVRIFKRAPVEAPKSKAPRLAISTGEAIEQQITEALELLLERLPYRLERFGEFNATNRQRWLRMNPTMKLALDVGRLVQPYLRDVDDTL